MSQRKIHKEEIRKANSFIQEKVEAVKKSKYKPVYHFSPPVGWMNDPNGFSYFNGEYHLFYQFYPYEPNWGPMHWGHAVSKDLIDWKHVPEALAPSEEYDYSEAAPGHGCFSGSAVEYDGKLYLVYTGSIGEEGIQTQNIAVSEDGILFEKSESNPVIHTIPEGASRDFRDPKVWEHNGMFYAVIGTKKGGKGKVALYSSADLKDWNFVTISIESEEGQGDMWECPDLFHVDGADILIVSPMLGTVNHQPFYIQGQFSYETGKFKQEEYAILDHGHDFYAPQTMEDKHGRRILIAWMEKWNSKMPSKQDGWSGAMTVPRELTFKNGKLLQEPIEEVNHMRTNEREYTTLQINKRDPFKTELSAAADIVMKIDAAKSQAEKFSFFLKSSEDKTQSTKLIFDLTKKIVIMDRKHAGEGEETSSEAPINVENDRLDIRILLDRNSCELFVNGGETVMSNRVYPAADSNYFMIEAEGELLISNINIYDLAIS